MITINSNDNDNDNNRLLAVSETSVVGRVECLSSEQVQTSKFKPVRSMGKCADVFRACSERKEHYACLNVRSGMVWLTIRVTLDLVILCTVSLVRTLSLDFARFALALHEHHLFFICSLASVPQLQSLQRGLRRQGLHKARSRASAEASKFVSLRVLKVTPYRHSRYAKEVKEPCEHQPWPAEAISPLPNLVVLAMPQSLAGAKTLSPIMPSASLGRDSGRALCLTPSEALASAGIRTSLERGHRPRRGERKPSIVAP